MKNTIAEALRMRRGAIPGGSGRRMSGAPGSRAGFSLVELIIIVAVIGVLVGVSIPALTRWLHNSEVSVEIQAGADIAELINSAVAQGAFRSIVREQYGDAGIKALDGKELQGNPTNKNQLTKVLEALGASASLPAMRGHNNKPAYYVARFDAQGHCIAVEIHNVLGAQIAHPTRAGMDLNAYQLWPDSRNVASWGNMNNFVEHDGAALPMKGQTVSETGSGGTIKTRKAAGLYK